MRGAAHPRAVVPATRNEAPMDGDATLARAQLTRSLFPGRESELENTPLTRQN